MGGKVNIEGYESIHKWLLFRAGTEATKKDYISKFKDFIGVTVVDPDKLIKEWKHVKHNPVEREKFIDKVSEIVEDFLLYCLRRKTITDLTKRHSYMVVKSFFKFYKIPLEVSEPILGHVSLFTIEILVRKKLSAFLKRVS